MLNAGKLDGLKRQIIALSKMTQENGCSEAEAMNAAQRLANLLDQHGLSIEEVRADAEAKTTASCEKDAWGSQANAMDAFRCARGVAHLFDLIYYQGKTRNENGYGNRITFYGYTQDVMAAKYLMDIIQEAMQHEWKCWYNPYNKTTNSHGRSIRAAFITGMATRINERLREMKTMRNQAPTTGTALVVLKNQVVKREFKTTGVRLTTGTYSFSLGNDGLARAAGRAAGDRVGLSTGPNFSGTRKLK